MNFTINTSNDSTLEVCSTKCTITDDKGLRNIDDEITLVIADFDQESNAIVSLSKSDAINLAEKLLQIAENLKSY